MNKIQTFENGILIAERESDIPDLPDWSAFNNALLNDAAYNRMAESSTNQRAVNRLEGIAIPLGIQGNDNGVMYKNIAAFWNSMMEGISVGLPTAEEIMQWNIIASATNMLFSFDEQGLMNLVNQNRDT